MITETIVKSLVSYVDKGLTCGLGNPEPGKMCVEAAVCYAFKEEHTDEPKCVNADLRECMIYLNDALPSNIENKQERAMRLRKLSIAQLGTNGRFAEVKFGRLTAKLVAKVAEEHLLHAYEGCGIGDFLDTLDVSIESRRKIVYKLSEGLLEILIEMKTPGSEWLYLADEPEPEPEPESIQQQRRCPTIPTIAPAATKQPQLLCVR